MGRHDVAEEAVHPRPQRRTLPLHQPENNKNNEDKNESENSSTARVSLKRERVIGTRNHWHGWFS
jgi:hypothetical protein